MKTYESGSRPRYDDGGSEFGDVHRELPKQFGMFDIDRMSATATVNLELTKQDVAFIEYRTLWNDESNSVQWRALFEVKHRDGPMTQKALALRKGTATWAQLKMAEALGARYFIVVATEGNQPFTFYEADDSGCMRAIGVLTYSLDGKASAINEFWKEIGLSP